MKRMVVLIFNYILILNIYSQVPYVLVFNEDFNDDFNEDFITYTDIYPDAEGGVNQKWSRVGDGRYCTDIPCIPEDALNAQPPENVIAENGIGKIYVKHEPNTLAYCPWNSSNPIYFDYTAGFLSSRQKFKRGLFEVRSKMPAENQGFHSSIWYYCCEDTEIDFTETFAPTPWKIRAETHCPSGCSDVQWYNMGHFGLYDPDSFYTYQLLWENIYYWGAYVDELTWYIDNQYIGIHYLRDYDPRFSIYLDIEVDHNEDCSYVFSADDTGYPWNGSFPTSFDIDWVKVWKKAYTTTDYEYINYDQTNTDESCIVGRNITLGGTGGQAIIQGGYWYEFNKLQHLVLAATEKISLKEGFHAEKGSYVHAFNYDVSGGDSNVKFKSTNPSDDYSVGSVKFVDTSKTAKTRPKQEIIDVQEGEQLLVYPNPSVGFITVQSRRDVTGIIKIYDQTGQNIFEKSISTNTEQIDISAFPKGIYYLIFETVNTTYKERIILN